MRVACGRSGGREKDICGFGGKTFKKKEDPEDQ